MPRIQQVPRGYLDALGIKSTGRNPGDTTEELRPTIDLTEMYLSHANEVVEETTLLASALGSSATATVPSGVVWRVLAFSGLVTTLTGAANLQFSVGIRSAGGSYFASAQNNPIEVAAVVNARYRLGVEMPVPLILSPGWGIACQFDQALSAGTATIQVRAMVNVFRI